MTLLKRCGVAVAIGSVFPIAYMLSYEVGLVHAFPDWGFVLWPTSIFLLATEGCTLFMCFAKPIAMALGLNAVIWAFLGVAASWLLDAWSAVRTAK